MKIWYIIYTFDRIYDSYIQMEIVRNSWSKYFPDIYLVHAYNWEKSKYKKYLENKLLTLKNPWHYEWASNLIDAWVKEVLKNDVDYIIVSAADTWLLKAEIIFEKIKLMQEKNKVLLSNPWWYPWFDDPRDVWLATDFFVLDAKWERKNKIFPLKYKEFSDKYLDLLRYLWRWNVMLEKLFFSKFVTTCSKTSIQNKVKEYSLSKILFFKERYPIHKNSSWIRNMSFPKIDLYTNHDFVEKREVFIKKDLKIWKYSEKLINNEL